MKEWLIGKTLAELQQIAADLSLPKYTASQIAQWLYLKRVKSIDMMTNLSKNARETLSQKYEVGGFEPSQNQLSVDGTHKYLFPVLEDLNTAPAKAVAAHGIEAVVIPSVSAQEKAESERATLCVSSQMGCQMGCKFCMTARMGFRAHLSAGEIMGQFLRVDESTDLTNVVFMGMGEPLNNWVNVSKALSIFTEPWGLAWSPRRITLSTVGIIPMFDTFMSTTNVHLAVSLHNPFDTQRAELMPVQKVYPISDVINKLRDYDFHGQRRLSFEYILFDGWNDTPRHATALLQLLRGMECRVNLIRFHAIPDFPLQPSSMEVVEKFKERLNRGGLLTTLRASRGQDIFAACGLLSGQTEDDEN